MIFKYLKNIYGCSSGNDSSVQNNWKGAWWHDSLTVHSGTHLFLVLGDTIHLHLVVRGDLHLCNVVFLSRLWTLREYNRDGLQLARFLGKSLVSIQVSAHLRACLILCLHVDLVCWVMSSSAYIIMHCLTSSCISSSKV